MKSIRVVLQMKWWHWFSKGLCSHFHCSQRKLRVLDTLQYRPDVAPCPGTWREKPCGTAVRRAANISDGSVACQEQDRMSAYGKAFLLSYCIQKSVTFSLFNMRRSSSFVLILFHIFIKIVFSMTRDTITNVYSSSPRKVNVRIFTELHQDWAWSIPGLLQYSGKWITNKTEVSLQSRSKCITVCNSGTIACILN